MLNRIEWLAVGLGAVAIAVGYAGASRAAMRREEVDDMPVWYLRACLKQPVEQGCYDVSRGGWTDLDSCRARAIAIAERTPGARMVCAVDPDMVGRFRR